MSQVVISSASASASATVIGSPQVSEAVISSLQVSETFRYKGRLQEFTQKSGIQLPVYQTIQEGPIHQARFRCTVWVNGVAYTSTNTFRQRKSAEQDAAREALEFVAKEGENTDFSHIPQDPVFSKSILNEYAVKMKLNVPVYTTVQQQGLLPVFISSVVFNGASYTGDVGKNKKDAEQLAARAAVLSLLGDDSESNTVLSEIIQSKHKLYAALHPVKNSDTQKEGSDIRLSMSEGEKDSPSLSSEGIRKLFMPITALSEPCSGQAMNHETNARQSLHIFKSPRAERLPQPTSTPPPIVFVPSSLGASCSHSGKKRKRKNKKKAAHKPQTASL